VEDHAPASVPGVDVALVVIGDDLEATVAEQVPGRQRADHCGVVARADAAATVGPFPEVKRQPLRVHRPSGQL
jgi:hypothetical protein